ncbi:MAG: hypothetical protein ABI212_05435 [Burkholderiaceae bacterium]
MHPARRFMGPAGRCIDTPAKALHASARIASGSANGLLLHRMLGA